MTIIEKCERINEKINNSLYRNNFLIKTGTYEKVFTSLDLIEDGQNAINEFIELNEDNIRSRTTLYIYGVLQVLFCQQDGVFHLYKTIKDNAIKEIAELFDIYKFDKSIRVIRNEIAGHPNNRNNGKEYYYIAKGSNSKYQFSYAGYTPELREFKHVEVNMLEFIEKQKDFVIALLSDIDNEIDKKMKDLKNKFRGMKLQKYLDDVNYPIQKIHEGISNNYPLAKDNLKVLKNYMDNLKIDLNKRYNNQIPNEIESCNFKLIDHILKKFNTWLENGELYGNIDAEVFYDSLEKQIEELKTTLQGIDEEFEN